MARVYLGKLHKDFKELGGEKLWLEKHSWDCEWYWGMGYLGNKDLHTHFDTTFLKKPQWRVEYVFEETKLTQDDWYILLDLFKQAYALQRAAEIYQYGGHITSQGNTDLIKDKPMADALNADVERLLNEIWSMLGGK